MWLRNTHRFSTIVQSIYRHPSIAERIRLFQGIEVGNSTYVPLSVQNPSFLRQARAKDILQFVKTNNIANNIRILHALAHIQYNAFMSYTDTLLRFKGETGHLQGEFAGDMRDIALEEGSHFNLLTGRLVQLGYDYGCMPVIPKLSLAIKETEGKLVQRIAVISLVHEGRGVKAVEKLLRQLQQQGDHQSVKVVRIIQRDEGRHFQMGWKWFFKVCRLKGLDFAEQLATINSKYKCNIVLPNAK